jgi:hypothetical protein
VHSPIPCPFVVWSPSLLPILEWQWPSFLGDFPDKRLVLPKNVFPEDADDTPKWIDSFSMVEMDRIRFRWLVHQGPQHCLVVFCFGLYTLVGPLLVIFFLLALSPGLLQHRVVRLW